MADAGPNPKGISSNRLGIEEAPLGGRVVKQPGERDEPGPGQQPKEGEPVHRPAIGRPHLPSMTFCGVMMNFPVFPYRVPSCSSAPTDPPG